MICSQEIRRAIQQKLALDSVPSGTATWAGSRYTCRYQLSVGRLLLSVQDSPNAKSGHSYFLGARERADGARQLPGLLGLGLPSFETRGGTVAFLKDGKTLTVDASALPNRLGPADLSRTDLAYAVAAAVVACWSE
jgi:hypothetical protein